jgi:hypothetical protein
MTIHQWDDTEEIFDREQLGKVARAKFEAQAFLDMHAGDYFATPQNGKLISDYVQKNKLPLLAESFEVAFETLKADGTLLPAREAVARMSADELTSFAAEHGAPVYGPNGRLLGHNLPEAYSASSEGYNRPSQPSRYTQSRLPSHPEDVKRNPSKREFAMWPADRADAWLQERGYWGGDLPEFLR